MSYIPPLRSVCVKCGRKRKSIYLKSAYFSNSTASYSIAWRAYPRRDSKICIEKCLEYEV